MEASNSAKSLNCNWRGIHGKHIEPLFPHMTLRLRTEREIHPSAEPDAVESGARLVVVWFTLDASCVLCLYHSRPCNAGHEVHETCTIHLVMQGHTA